MRMTKTCDNNKSCFFRDVEEMKEKPKIYRMWPKSLNRSNYIIEHFKPIDNLFHDYLSSIYSAKFTYCKYTIKHFDETYIVNFKGIMIISEENTLSLNFIIVFYKSKFYRYRFTLFRTFLAGIML
ncbi:hypothetical protein COBT_001372 [Conglomerata obtusa]